jgi:hypothetical protein
LPLVDSPPEFFVPTQTSSVSVAATASLPVMFDYAPVNGDPDLPSASLGSGSLCSTSPSSSYTPIGGTVAAGEWGVAPSECGPYPAPAPAGTVSVSMTAMTKAFDSAVTSPTNDVWLASVDPATTVSPVQVNAGQTATINVTITPNAAGGTVVSGNLYVDDLATDVPPYGQFSGDELAAIPYEYTVGN